MIDIPQDRLADVIRASMGKIPLIHVSKGGIDFDFTNVNTGGVGGGYRLSLHAHDSELILNFGGYVLEEPAHTLDILLGDDLNVITVFSKKRLISIKEKDGKMQNDIVVKMVNELIDAYINGANPFKATVAKIVQNIIAQARSNVAEAILELPLETAAKEFVDDIIHRHGDIFFIDHVLSAHQWAIGIEGKWSNFKEKPGFRLAVVNYLLTIIREEEVRGFLVELRRTLVKSPTAPVSRRMLVAQDNRKNLMKKKS